MAVPPDRGRHRLSPEPARLTVRITPRGGRDGVDGWTADAEGRPMLKVRVAAAASDGAANSALIALIARTLGVPKSAVRIAGGHTARVKRVEVEGATPEDLVRVYGTP